MSTPADQTRAARLRLLLLLATAGVRERSLVESEAANRKWHPSVLSDAVAEGLIDDDQTYLYLSPAGEEALGKLCRNASTVSDIDDPVLVLEQFEVLDME